jgi:hypothetical protein
MDEHVPSFTLEILDDQPNPFKVLKKEIPQW